MSSALSARVCPKRSCGSMRGSCAPRPRLLAARPQLQAELRVPLEPARGKVLNTEYNADPDAYDAMDTIDMTELDMADPTGVVGDIMTSKNVRSSLPDQSLRSVDSKLDKVTGMPVTDENNVVVGVISKKDINRLRKQGVSFDLPVSQFMSSPPLVVKRSSKIGEAASIMLSKKIHRLCVVDDEGKLLGIVSRTDIFNPLVQSERCTVEMLTEMGADANCSTLQQAIEKSIDLDKQAKAATEDDAWVIKYLYDGDCSMCQALVAMLKRQDDGRGLIKFVNIASMTYNPRANEGVEYEEAMETIHAIKRDGTIMTGPPALKELYSTVGLGWAATLGNLPIISNIVDWLYEVVSKLRLPMGKQLDAVLALRRMKMTTEGIEHCVDDEEECHAEW